MDAFNPAALTAEQFVGVTAYGRTDVYRASGTPSTLRESIEIQQPRVVRYTGELKRGDPTRIQSVLDGQEQYARRIAEEMREARVGAREARPQSFNVKDLLYRVKNTQYGNQSVSPFD